MVSRQQKTHSDDWRRGLFFNDGKTSIDYVFIWQTSENSKIDIFTEETRLIFCRNLIEAGIQLEEDVQVTPTCSIHYMKVHVPWKLMCIEAEELNLKVSIQIQEVNKKKRSFAIKSFGIFNHEMPTSVPQYITTPFRLANIESYVGCEDQTTFFSTTQRHQVAHSILAKTVYGNVVTGQVGIHRLVEEAIYNAAFPINDGPYKSTAKERLTPHLLSKRQILFNYWAKWSCWYKKQPLDHIREYYGEKIGLYFAWLGLYTQWLLPAGIVGLFCFIYGVATENQFIPSQEVCSTVYSIRMCPFCKESQGCTYWHLHDLCNYRRLSYLFDHPGTVFFAIFMVCWSVLFMEFWKRTCAQLTYKWSVFDYECEEEVIRPQFANLCNDFKPNPITGRTEPTFPKSVHYFRVTVCVMISLLMVAAVIIFMIAVIIYRSMITIPLFQNPNLRSQANTFATMSGAFLNLILIVTLDNVYQSLAYKMTEWEMHPTQSEFDTALTIKVFLFQFVNYYSSLFYIAFFKGKFIGHPGKFASFLGLRNEECSAGGCLFELAQQLLIIMVGKQIINNCTEIILPLIKSWLHKRSSGVNHFIKDSNTKDGSTLSNRQCMEDYNLVQNQGLSEEYLEMILQFGFITLFVSAAPLAPLLALINNWIEIRIDAQKLVCSTRRPVAERAKSIGIWFKILEIIVGISIISNALIIAFTSDFLQKMLYMYEVNWNLVGYTNFTLVDAPINSTRLPCKYQAFQNAFGEYTPFYWRLFTLRLGFVLIFEHLAFLLTRLIDIIIPDIPKRLKIKLFKERFLTKKIAAFYATKALNLNSANVNVDVFQSIEENLKT